MKTSSEKFQDLKDRRNAENLWRTFYWLTPADQDRVDKFYKELRSYKIIQKLKTQNR